MTMKAQAARYLAFGTVLAAAVSLAGVALSQAADEGMYVPAKDLEAKVVTLTDGVASAPAPTGGGIVLIARRDRDGEVEVHTGLHDELIAREGKAQIRVGGKVTGNRQTGPGEWRGGTMTGGRTYPFSKGDVIWIPAGAPHQMLVPKGTSFTYIAVKFEAKPQ